MDGCETSERVEGGVEGVSGSSLADSGGGSDSAGGGIAEECRVRECRAKAG